MKRKILLAVIALSALTLTNCGPAARMVAEVDAAMISLTSPKKKQVVVKVGNNSYNVKTTKNKAAAKPAAAQPQTNATNRTTATKQSSRNTVRVEPGQHDVTVTEKKTGREVYNNRVSVQKDERRTIDLD